MEIYKKKVGAILEQVSMKGVTKQIGKHIRDNRRIYTGKTASKKSRRKNDLGPSRKTYASYAIMKLVELRTEFSEKTERFREEQHYEYVRLLCDH
jgi:hypothetical protein